MINCTIRYQAAGRLHFAGSGEKDWAKQAAHNDIVVCITSGNTCPNPRSKAFEMYVDAMNLPRITRRLKVHHRTVALWVVDHATALPEAPMPEEVKDA